MTDNNQLYSSMEVHRKKAIMKNVTNLQPTEIKTRQTIDWPTEKLHFHKKKKSAINHNHALRPHPASNNKCLHPWSTIYVYTIHIYTCKSMISYIFLSQKCTRTQIVHMKNVTVTELKFYYKNKNLKFLKSQVRVYWVSIIWFLSLLIDVSPWLGLFHF